MVKLIIFVVLGLAVGLGGGSAAAVMKAKKVFNAALATRAAFVADSIANPEAHATEGGEDHAAPAADTHADSNRAPSAAADDHGAKKDDHGATKDDHAPPAKVAASHEPAKAPATTHAEAGKATVESHGATTPTPGTGQSSATDGEVPAKVAKIFSMMPAADAAKVLELMDAKEMQSVVSAMSDKQAAAVLQKLPADKAAALAKALIQRGSVKP